MVRFSNRKIREHFQRGETADTTTEKGRALEDLVCYIFGKVPGITVSKRNELNVFNTEEIDVAFWNEKHSRGFYFLPFIILVECKNWSRPVGSDEIGYFSKKLQNRGLDLGILVATRGITGTSQSTNRAHFEVAMEVSRGLRIVVLTREEIESLVDTNSLVKLVKEKLCELVVSGTVIETS